MTDEIPEQCNATARCMSALLVCDRERGHDGPHRSYWPEIDESMFWTDRRRYRGVSVEVDKGMCKSPTVAALALDVLKHEDT